MIFHRNSLDFLVELLQILAMDINRENYELGLPVIQKAGVAHKIDFREGPALPVLDELVKDVITLPSLSLHQTLLVSFLHYYP